MARTGSGRQSSSSATAPLNAIRKRRAKSTAPSTRKISALVAQAIKEGSTAAEICFEAAVLAGKACEAACDDDMLADLLEQQHSSLPHAPGPPFPWEWASLSDGSFVHTGWGAARGTPTGCREVRTEALNSYARQIGGTIDWMYGRKLHILRELRWTWAEQAWRAAAKKLGYSSTPRLRDPRGGDLLPPLRAHMVQLEWNEARGAFERGDPS